MVKLIFELFLLNIKVQLHYIKYRNIFQSFSLCDREYDYVCTTLWIKWLRLLVVGSDGVGAHTAPCSTWQSLELTDLLFWPICNKLRNIRGQKLGSSELRHRKMVFTHLWNLKHWSYLWDWSTNWNK